MTVNIQLSPIKQFRILADSIENAVSLGQGTPSFKTDLLIKNAAQKAMYEQNTDWYGDPRGLKELRWEISTYTQAEDKVYYNPETEILVTPGSICAMNLVFLSLFNKGDEILIITPTYYPFFNLPKLVGAKAIQIPMNYHKGKWSLNKQTLKKGVTNKTKAILICQPNNPTGTVLTNSELTFIKELIANNDILLLIDEVYRYFTYVNENLDYSIFADIKDKILRFMSFSKAWSMSGWRCGYVVGHEKYIKKTLPVSDLVLTASSTLVSQYAALAAIKNGKTIPQKYRRVLSKRRLLMGKLLKEFPDIFESAASDAGFYYFVKLTKKQDDFDFCFKLLQNTGVVLIPGSTFGEAGKGFVRLSYSREEKDIKEAFKRLKEYKHG